MGIQRITVAGVPVDILRPEDMEEAVLELLEKPGAKQIVFLSIWGLLKARRRGDFQECVKNASIVIPISKSIISGASFLKKEIPIRYNPFNAIISILTILDNHFKSLYLLGSHLQSLHIAERNLRVTFPQLKILGRYPGYFSKSIEPDVIQAIYKSAPSLVLQSEGIKGRDCWAWIRRGQFSSSIFVYYKESFEIFSKRIKRVSEKTFERGNEIYHEVFRNPFKVFLIFPFLWYILVLVWYRLFKKR